MPPRLLWLLAAVAVCSGCSSYRDSAQYQQAAAVSNHVADHAFVLRHTAPGSYSYETSSAGLGIVVLTVAGVTNTEDQDAILDSLRSHRADKDRDWSKIRVLFYHNTVPTAQGVNYVDLLRQEVIQP